MESSADLKVPDFVREERTAKLIAELDGILRVLLKDLPQSKPWQRHLLAQLTQADRCMQVLRMTICLLRPYEEVRDATDRLLVTLRAAHVSVSTGRADIGTKTTIRIVFNCTQRLAAAIGR